MHRQDLDRHADHMDDLKRAEIFRKDSFSRSSGRHPWIRLIRYAILAAAFIILMELLRRMQG